MNLQCPCFSLLSAGIIGIHSHIQLRWYFYMVYTLLKVIILWNAFLINTTRKKCIYLSICLERDRERETQRERERNHIPYNNLIGVEILGKNMWLFLIHTSKLWFILSIQKFEKLWIILQVKLLKNSSDLSPLLFNAVSNPLPCICLVSVWHW
jgi:hypothetical protein